MSPKTKRLIWSLILSAAITLLVGGVFWLGIFGTWQDKLADKLFLKREPSSQIIILAIDQDSLDSLGQWPWSRETHARVLEYLALGQPKVVGYDVMFSEPSGRGAKDDELLAEAMGQLPVILPVEAAPLKIGDSKKFSADKIIDSLAIFDRRAAGRGMVNVLADADGVVRRLPLVIDFNGTRLPAFSWQLAQAAGATLSDLATDTLRVNFVGPPGSFKTISLVDVYQQRVAVETFKDKIVLVGVTGPDLHDSQMTPFSLGQAMAGVEIHANALDTILSKKFLRDVGRSNVWLFIFLLSLAVAVIFSGVRRLWLAVALSLSVWLIYILAALAAFEEGAILNLVYPSLAFVLSLIGVLAYHYFFESKEKRYLRQSFQLYLAPSVIEEIVKDPANLKLGGDKKDMTVLFSDIRGFTALSEKTDPETLVGLLNEYFTAMTDIILQSGGVLDKFIGDAIMAFWGAPKDEPDHAKLACETALDMMARLETLKQEWSSRGLPEINIGVGVNSGQMVVGNIGSDSRFNYTVIGDNVNLASRLEGLNKQYGTNIIIGQFTYERVKDDFDCEYLDKANIKGKEAPVAIYRLIRKKAGIR